jgi:hypothetical protein
MSDQPNPTTTELAARLRECSAQPDCPFALGLEIGTAADELERLAAEVERLSGLIHSCPKCGEFCKQCRCWNDELAEARVLILEGGFNPRQRADDYHLRRDAFLARTSTAEGEQILNDDDREVIATAKREGDRAKTDAVLSEIAAERKKQISKGWTAEHDDRHTAGEIAIIAGYVCQEKRDRWKIVSRHANDRRQQLVIAAALVVAEIERLDRKAEGEQP